MPEKRDEGLARPRDSALTEFQQSLYEVLAWAGKAGGVIFGTGETRVMAAVALVGDAGRRFTQWRRENKEAKARRIAAGVVRQLPEIAATIASGAPAKEEEIEKRVVRVSEEHAKMFFSLFEAALKDDEDRKDCLYQQALCWILRETPHPAEIRAVSAALESLSFDFLYIWCEMSPGKNLLWLIQQIGGTSNRPKWTTTEEWWRAVERAGLSTPTPVSKGPKESETQAGRMVRQFYKECEALRKVEAAE